MWTTLAARMDGANNSVGRMTLYRTFSSLCPTAGQPISAYFGLLLKIRNQLIGTDEAITNTAFKTHIFTTLSPMFAVTIEILQFQANITIDKVLDVLKECEKNKAMVVVPDAVSEALYTQQGGRVGSLQGGRGGQGAYQGRRNYQGKGRSPNVWCDWCSTATHTTANCWTKETSTSKRSREDPTDGCYHCGEEGHIRYNCPAMRKGHAIYNRRDTEQRGKDHQTKETGNLQ